MISQCYHFQWGLSERAGSRLELFLLISTSAPPLSSEPRLPDPLRQGGLSHEVLTGENMPTLPGAWPGQSRATGMSLSLAVLKSFLIWEAA